MTPEDYAALDAVAIDELVTAGTLTPADVAAAAYEMHQRWHDTINAVLEWYDDPTPPRSVEGGPALRGVPILRKDYGSAEAGRLVEMGSRLARGNRAGETAPFIGRLQAAGAQIVGRSAVPEFIQHGTTESRVHGATRNPWDPTVSAGGSSGGAGAAVAAGVVPVAHASDCAGSIRIPASVCGLVGLKPGRGRVPWPGQDWDGVATEFVLTRSVRDARRCLDILGDHAAALPPRVQLARVAVSTDHWAGYRTDDAVVAAVDAVAATLADAGHEIRVIDNPVDFESVMQLWVPCFNRFALIDAERAAAMSGRTIDDSTVEPITLEVIELARRLTATDMDRAARQRAWVTNALDEAMAEFDVLMTPTLGRSTIPLGTVDGEGSLADYGPRNDEIFPYSWLFNVAGWASLSIPGPPTADGHPVGVQLSGRPGSEELLLDLATQVEQAMPWPTQSRYSTPGSTHSIS